MRTTKILFASRWAAAAILSFAMTAASAEISVHDAWSRATPPGHPTGAVYFKLVNDGDRGDQIIGVRSDRAPRVELHQTIEEGGNARMIHTPEVRVPANSEVIFEPGGRHVMFMGLQQSLVEGETYDIVLELERAGDITVPVVVRAATARGDDHGHMNH